jgi:hypothetical protein
MRETTRVRTECSDQTPCCSPPTDRGVFDFPVEPKPDNLGTTNGPGIVTLETLHADLQTLIAMVRDLKK